MSKKLRKILVFLLIFSVTTFFCIQPSKAVNNSDVIKIDDAEATVQELIDYYTSIPPEDLGGGTVAKEETVKAVLAFWNNVDKFNASIPIGSSYESIKSWMKGFIKKETSNPSNENLIRYSNAFKQRAIDAANKKIDEKVSELNDSKNKDGANKEAIDKTIDKLNSYKNSSAVFENEDKMKEVLDTIENAKKQIADPSVNPYSNPSEAEANKFKEDNKEILGKEVANVTESDEAAVDKALSEYEKLSEEAKNLLTSEKTKLDEMKKKIEKDKANKGKTANKVVKKLPNTAVEFEYTGLISIISLISIVALNFRRKNK